MQRWETTFDMRPTETAYQVVALDKHGFQNMPPPRRKLEIEIEKEPVVEWLPEQFSWAGSDFSFEGVPLPVGERIPIAYKCNHPYGLGWAHLKYRVQKKPESGNDPPSNEKFIAVPLHELTEKQLANCGDFDPTRGFFPRRPKMQVPFFAVPAEIPSHPSRMPELGRIKGGGRIDFATGEFDPKEKGPPLPTPQIGDVIEYYIEVSPEPAPGNNSRPVGKTPSRFKNVVEKKELLPFMLELIREESVIRGLRKHQEDVLPSALPFLGASCVGTMASPMGDGPFLAASALMAGEPLPSIDDN